MIARVSPSAHKILNTSTSYNHQQQDEDQGKIVILHYKKKISSKPSSSISDVLLNRWLSLACNLLDASWYHVFIRATEPAQSRQKVNTFPKSAANIIYDLR